MFAGNSKLLGFPIGPDRLLFGLGVVLLLLDPVALRQQQLRLRPVHLAGFAVVLIAAGSAMSHGTFGKDGFYAWLDRLTVPLLMFVLAPIVFRTPERRDLLLRVLVVIGCYLGLTAIFEVVGPHALVFPRFILDPNVGSNSGARAARSRSRKPTDLRWFNARSRLRWPQRACLANGSWYRS